ncbi:MAG: hypothetical protein JW771_07155 [Candidatus Thermoplasmatota archaeon]|nr:hypothetical protein [Candidatus Thermoplasmatota archaeon]
MKKQRVTALVVIVLFLWCFIVGSPVGAASKAGVGVLNVPPTFRMIRLVQQDNTIRIYLTLSDYNSWEDIFSASVTLEDSGLDIATFTYQQYSDRTSWIKTNQFNETSSKDLLIVTKCSYDSSRDRETVEDRCNLVILFVFQTDFFTRLHIVASDREGATATASIDYNADEMIRNSEIIVIPGVDEPVSVTMPPYLLNLLALLMAVVGTFLVIRKIDKQRAERVAYEHT